jgi:hypothetical protein
MGLSILSLVGIDPEVLVLIKIACSSRGAKILYLGEFFT